MNSGRKIGALQDHLQARAREWVWKGTTWKTIAEAASAAGVSVSEVNGWIAARKIFAPERDGVALLPAYAFEPDGTPLPVVARVIEELGEIYGDLGIAAFFESTSGFLEGARPREIIATQPDRVAAAAKFNADTVRYG